MTHKGICARSMVLLRITLFFTPFFYPALGFFHPLPASQLTSSNYCQLQNRLSSSRVVCARQRQLRSASLSDGTSVGACSFSGISLSRERSVRWSRLRMSSSIAPPVKPPKKRGWGGGGRGDDLYVRELVEPEKSEILTAWRDFAKADGSERFMESIQILNEMIAWRSGVIAARKRRFTLACCKGTAVQAVACVQIGPKNESVRSFLAQDACMSLCLLIVDPEAPMFKAGAHLCKEIKEIGRSENMTVDFQPIKDIYSGRFYAATLAM